MTPSVTDTCVRGMVCQWRCRQYTSAYQSSGGGFRVFRSPGLSNFIFVVDMDGLVQCACALFPIGVPRFCSCVMLCVRVCACVCACVRACVCAAQNVFLQKRNIRTRNPGVVGKHKHTTLRTPTPIPHTHTHTHTHTRTGCHIRGRDRMATLQKKRPPHHSTRPLATWHPLK